MAKQPKTYESKYGNFELLDHVGVRLTGDKIAGKIVFKIYFDADEMAQLLKILPARDCFDFGQKFCDHFKVVTTPWRMDTPKTDTTPNGLMTKEIVAPAMVNFDQIKTPEPPQLNDIAALLMQLIQAQQQKKK